MPGPPSTRWLLVGLLIVTPARAVDLTGEAALRHRVERIEMRLATLEARRRADHRLSLERARRVRALVEQVLLDASGRSALADGPGSAGWNGRRLFIRSADGRFELRIRGRLQTRFVYNHQDQAPVGADDRHGFEVRRVRLGIEGHLLDPAWRYKVSLSSTQGSPVRISDAWVRRDLGPGLVLMVGQFKLPFTREFMQSFTRQLAVERSLVDRFFRLGRAAGVELLSRGERVRLYGAWSNGADTQNAAALAPDAALALTGRADLRAAGTWEQLQDFTSPRGTPFGLLLGVAVHYQEQEHGATSFEARRLGATADVTADLDFGVSLFGSLTWDRRASSDPSVPTSRPLGAVVQGGVYVSERCELFARYEWADADTAGVPDLSVLTVGLNWYVRGQRLRWASDVGVGFQPVAPEFASSGAGWRADSAGRDGQVVVRGQLQLEF